MRDLGTAKSENFMLSTAEVRIGPQGSVFDLDESYSIGLVKNFNLSAEMTETTLAQGLRNRPVYSVITGAVVTATMEVYEYTPKNLAYGLGLATGTVYTDKITTTASASVTGNGTVVAVSVADESNFSAGDYALITTTKGIVVRTVASTAAGELTFDQAFPTGVDIESGAEIGRTNVLSVGNPSNEFYSAKVITRLADGTDMAVLIPKLRIIRGFNLSVTTQDFGNMPFEMSTYDLVESDANYSSFRDEPVKLLIN